MRRVKTVFLSALLVSPLYALSDYRCTQKSLCEAHEYTQAASIDEAFKEGKIEGEIRLAYISQENDAVGTANTYASVVGGQLKYETAKFYDISLAASAFVSQKIGALSGDHAKSELNLDMLGANGDSFAYIGEAYIDYAYDHFDLRIGRQKLDTPLNDRDDIRLLPNTFEAAMVGYGGVKDFVFTAGYIDRWAGYDSGADISKFKDMPSTTGADGVLLVGVMNESLENIELQAWYYDFDKQAGVVYLDAMYGAEYSSGISAEAGVQYVNYNEQASSTDDGEVYGGMLGAGYEGFSVGFAYNEVSTADGKKITLGYGGGPYFTSMEEMTINDMNDADAFVVSAGADLSQSVLENLNLAYAYGKFNGKNSAGSAVKVEENDIVLSYEADAQFNIEASYACVNDKVNSGTSDTGYKRFLVRLNYNF